MYTANQKTQEKSNIGYTPTTRRPLPKKVNLTGPRGGGGICPPPAHHPHSRPPCPLPCPPAPPTQSSTSATRPLGPSRLGNYSNGRTMYKHSTRNRPLVLEPWNWKLVCIQIESYVSEIVCATTLEIISIFTYFGNVFSDSEPLGKKNMLRSLCIKIATPSWEPLGPLGGGGLAST